MMGGGGLQLVIERTDLDGKKVSFNTQPGVVYEIQQSSDLQNWSLLQRMVANETTASFHAFNQGNQFYRVLQGDDSIQFPEWEGFIEQYMHFDVWTPVQGIYHLELYSDGSLAYQTTQPIPADGFFGVYDPAYNPNEWPFTGYYGVNEWELRVTVTPSAAGAAATQATVTKKQRRRNQTRIGTTVQQYNAFSISYLIQEEIDDWMLYYFLANMQASRQVALDGSNLNEFIAAGAVPRLISNNDWANLKNLIYGPASSVRLSDLHYFGHGTNTHIGSFSNPARRISLSELTGSLLATSPMRYVALDGCKTAETTDFLKAWVGHGSKYSRQHFLDKGWDPVFAWGWKNAKPVAFERQGILLDEHFWFVADYYWFLTQRDLGGNGYLFHTYQESILFGQNPGGGSPYHTRTRNTEGDSINYVGCYDCVFDLP